MMIKKILIFIPIALITFNVYSQKNDFGIWYSADAEYKLLKGLKADVAGSLRTDNNASDVYSYWFEGGLSYKLTKYLSAGAHYRLKEAREDNNNFYARHIWSAEIKGEIPVDRFTISARYKFQQQNKMYIEDPEDELPGYMNRFRLKVDYNIKGIPVNPYFATEALSQTFSSNGILIEKMRYMTGLSYDFNKKHSVNLSYIFQNSKTSKPEKFNIVSLNYSVKL